MFKKRTDLNEFALPVPGIRARRTPSDRIRIEGSREQAPSIRTSDALPAPVVDHVSEQDHANPFGLTTQNGAAPAKASPHTREELAILEDSELLTLFQAGEEKAFYTLFERRQKEIYSHCFRMCARDGEKANDAFQDTFVKVFTRKALFTDATNGRAWLYRIATNTCLNYIRYDKRHPREALDENLNSQDPQMQPDYGTEQESLRNSLEAAIAELPIELREPFLLREIDEFSYEDAAAQLGITVPACRQRVYRAKQLLREALEDVVTGEAPTNSKRR
jgi:RNA polymerase sigma-70 factor (ECF subfamily)